jgi:hypothetical protein
MLELLAPEWSPTRTKLVQHTDKCTLQPDASGVTRTHAQVRRTDHTHMRHSGVPQISVTVDCRRVRIAVYTFPHSHNDKLIAAADETASLAGTKTNGSHSMTCANSSNTNLIALDKSNPCTAKQTDKKFRMTKLIL